MGLFLNLITRSKDMTPEQRQDVAKRWVVIICLAVLLVFLLAGQASTTKVGSDSAAWDVVIYARLYLVRAVGAFGAFALSMGALHLAWNWLETTSLGHELHKDHPLAPAITFLALALIAAAVFAVVVR